jgi:hypothetical protein
VSAGSTSRRVRRSRALHLTTSSRPDEVRADPHRSTQQRRWASAYSPPSKLLSHVGRPEDCDAGDRRDSRNRPPAPGREKSDSQGPASLVAASSWRERTVRASAVPDANASASLICGLCPFCRSTRLMCGGVGAALVLRLGCSPLTTGSRGGTGGRAAHMRRYVHRRSRRALSRSHRTRRRCQRRESATEVGQGRDISGRDRR